MTTTPPPMSDGAAGLAEAARRFGSAPTDPAATAAIDALRGALRRERQLRRDAERQVRAQEPTPPPAAGGAAGLAEAARRYGSSPADGAASSPLVTVDDDPIRAGARDGIAGAHRYGIAAAVTHLTRPATGGGAA